MSKYEDMITDQELRALLNRQILSGKAGDELDETIMDMEAKRIFAVNVAILPPLHKETELVNRLKSKFAAKAGLKWLFGGLLAVSAIAYLFQASYKPSGDEARRDVIPAVPSMNITEEDTARNNVNEPVSAIPDGMGKTGDRLITTSFPMLSERPAALNADETIELADHGPSKFSKEPDDVPPLHAATVSGTLFDRAPDKQKILVDTMFAGIKRLEVYSTICNTNIEARKVDNVSLKGELNIETRGLVAMRSDYRIQYERTGDLLKVTVVNAGKHNSLFVGALNYDGYLNFIVPETTDLVVKNSSGDISVKNLSSKVFELEALYGNISIADIHSDAKLVSSSGKMDVQRLDGRIDAVSGYGDQSFSDVNGNIKSTSASGNVTLVHLSGSLELSASYGNVSMHNIRGDIKVFSGSGNVTGFDIQAKKSRISASYGNIKLENIVSPLEVDSRSGRVSLQTITGSVIVHSTYGNQVLGSIQGDITSRSTSGEVAVTECSGNIEISLGYGDADLKNCKGNVKVISSSGDIRGTNIELTDRMELKAVYGDIRMNLKNNPEDLSFDLATSYGNIKVGNGGTLKSKSNGSLLIEKGRIRITGITSSGNQWFD
jgi:DUF4097 and DUF4098 domain-containing protein YvlB